MDLNHDFTKQVKRSDDFISQQLKDLSNKSFMVVASSNVLGRFSDNKFFKNNRKVMKKGAVIRTGDIIKLGRVPIMIKESSIDTQRFENSKDSEFSIKGNHMELDVLSQEWNSPQQPSGNRPVAADSVNLSQNMLLSRQQTTINVDGHEGNLNGS